MTASEILNGERLTVSAVFSDAARQAAASPEARQKASETRKANAGYSDIAEGERLSNRAFHNTLSAGYGIDHHQAAKSHKEAADHWKKFAGFEHHVEKHEKQAEFHTGKSKEKGEKVFSRGGNLTASDIIGAADQTGHVFHGNQWVKTGGLPWQGADTKWQPGGSYPEDAKLKAFAEKVHQDTHQRYLDEFGNPDLHQHYVKVKQGNKFDKVDVGGSGAFMVEKGTGQIYGVKAYGVVHPGKRYGTLDTIHEYNWGNHYYPVHKDASKPRVVTPVKPIPSHGTSHRSDYFQEHHADGSISLAASQQLTASDILRAGAPVGNRNAEGAHHLASQIAFEDSEKAERKTKLAQASNDIDDHYFASGAHRSAAQHHEYAAKKLGIERTIASNSYEQMKLIPGLEAKMKEHTEKKAYHEKQAALHKQKSNETAKASSGLWDKGLHAPTVNRGIVHREIAAYSKSDSDAIQARAASDVIYAGATHSFTVTASSQWELGKPVEFMYMPGGVHTICAHFRGQAIKLTVAVDPSDAAKVLNGSLEQLRASYKHPPFGCVEHEEKDASVWAKQFTAKGDGVYLAADPSELGVRHVNGLVHRSWSPSFLTDADYSKATLEDGTYQFPDGVRGSESNPAKITGCAFCLGTLTNKPAFREMSPVKAREAGAVKAAEPTKPTEPKPFNASALLDVARALRVAHWNGNTATNEHEALGELYDAWEDGLDELVEATCGKRGCKVSEPAQGNTALAEQALSALSGVKDILTAEDDDLLNIVADMENAVNKGRYLLKAKESDMTASEVLKATWSDAARKSALEARKNHNLADEDKWNVFGPGTSAHDQNANSFQIEVPGGNLRGDSVQYNINPLSRRKGFGLSSAGHPHSPGLWQEHGTFNTHKQAMKAAHEHYHTTISEAATSKASDASPSPSLVRAITAADILNHLAPDGADGKPAVQ